MTTPPAQPTADCPSDATLERLHARELDAAATEAVHAHLEVCDDCAARAARMVEQQEKILKRIQSWDLQARRMAVGPASPPPTPPNIGSGGSATVVESPLPEGVIAGYDVVREIHRGGQGVVYQAVQRSTKRAVAIKVLLEGPFASRAARRRFDREIELVANLKHANIVAVFDSGATRDGRQYWVMDYVQGRRLDHYVREERLDARRMMALFAQVCDAINFAHQRGVIHRDLKPSNILVDTDGVPRVLDFGLAKQMTAPDDPLVSVTGQVVGTLPYLAPEVARGGEGDVDVRADVYALGVLFYELLTGHFPYPVTGQLAAVLQHIAETPPTRPSTAWSDETGVSSTFAGRNPIDDEVETIALKALAKEPQRRYQTAGELARDLQHYLAGEPVEAKRDSAWYMLRKTLRRRRGTVVAAAVVLVLLVAWGATTSYFYAEQKHQTRRIAEEADRAKRRFDQVRELARAFVFDVHDAIADLPGATPARVLLVKNATQYLDNLSKEAGDDTALIRELATAYAKVGDVQGSVRVSNIGDTAGAMASYKKALALLESIQTTHPDPFVLKGSLAMMHARVGDMHWSMGDMEKSLAEYRTGRELGREMLAMNRNSVDAAHQLVSRAQDIADVLLQIGRRDEAVREFEDALKLIEPLAQKPDADAESVILCAINYDRLANIAMDSGHTNDAMDLYRRSLRLRETQAAAHPGSVRHRVFLANSLNQISNLLSRNGRPDEALPYALRARDLRKSLVDADPNDARAKFELAVSHDQIADIYLKNADFDAALVEQRAALALREAISGKDQTNAWYRDGVAVSHDAIGESLYHKGENAAAEAEFRKAMAIREELLARNPTDQSLTMSMGTTLTSLGNVVWKLNKADEARAAFVRAMTIRADAMRRSPNDISAILAYIAVKDRVADLLMFENKLGEAQREFDECHTLARQALDIEPEHRPTRRCHAVAVLKLGIIASAFADVADLSVARRIEYARTAVARLEECDRLVQKMRADGLTNANDAGFFKDIEDESKAAREKLARLTGQAIDVEPTTHPESLVPAAVIEDRPADPD